MPILKASDATWEYASGKHIAGFWALSKKAPGPVVDRCGSATVLQRVTADMFLVHTWLPDFGWLRLMMGYTGYIMVDPPKCQFYNGMSNNEAVDFDIPYLQTKPNLWTPNLTPKNQDLWSICGR